MITVRIEFEPGSELGASAREAIAFANRVQANVKFDWNGVDVLARDHDSASEVTARYYTEAKSKKLDPYHRQLWG